MAETQAMTLAFAVSMAVIRAMTLARAQPITLLWIGKDQAVTLLMLAKTPATLTLTIAEPRASRTRIAKCRKRTIANAMWEVKARKNEDEETEDIEDAWTETEDSEHVQSEEPEER
jgi:hypothetical protein